VRQATFDKLARVVYETSGISLSPSKRALLEARTAKRMRALGVSDHEAYLEILEMHDRHELAQFIDAVSTNVTGFFREPSHFDIVRQIVGQTLAEGRHRLRLWSAACASGEEPYSLAMAVLESSLGCQLDARILATDICTEALDRARRGVYTADRIEAIPAGLRRHAERIGRRQERLYRMREPVRDMVAFRRINLSTPPFPISGPLDVVFCRNVMIYFDQRVRSALLAEIHRVLRPGGWLFVGHAESLTARSDLFSLVQPSVFRRR